MVPAWDQLGSSLTAQWKCANRIGAVALWSLVPALDQLGSDTGPFRRIQVSHKRGCSLSLGCACGPFGHARSTQNLHCSTRTQNHPQRESFQTFFKVGTLLHCAAVSGVLVIWRSFTIVGSSSFREVGYYNGWRSSFQHPQSSRCLRTTRRSLPHTFDIALSTQ